MDEATLNIYTMTGKKVMHIDLVDGLNSIQTHSLSSSIYFYQITINNNLSKNGKLIVQ